MVNSHVKINQADIRKQERRERLFALYFGTALLTLFVVSYYATMFIELRVLSHH